MAYGTRRTSAQEAAPITIATGNANVPPSPSPLGSTIPLPSVSLTNAPSSSSLSTSIGKPRRPPAAGSSRRRLSSTSTTLRQAGQSNGVGIALSLPAPQALHLSAARARSGSVNSVMGGMAEDEDDGEVKGAALLAGKNRGQLYECEKCSKVYRHSTCLVKHRWEHTAHWKEASKLLLSKHQQVQLLEAAAILKAASAGSSLPDEKSLWPAAVSPPSSGLLGSHSLNINVLSSPRLPTSQLSTSAYSAHESSHSPPEHTLDEEDEDEGEEEAESVSTGDDMLTEGMFDMDLDDPDAAGRSRSVGADSGYDSITMGQSAPSAPALGFFPGTMGPVAVV